jgi:hypothetical protein
MRIGLKEIDPEIAMKAEDRLLAPIDEFLKENIHFKGLPFKFRWRWDQGGPTLERKREPTADERHAFDLRMKREEALVGRLIMGIMFPILGSAAGSILTSMGHFHPLIIASTAITLLGGGVSGGLWWAYNASPRKRLSIELSEQEMKAVFPLLSLNRAERLYCDALLLLSRISASETNEPIFRDMLKQLGDLLNNYRQLDLKRQSMLPVLGLHSIGDLEREFGELGRKLDATTDAFSRSAVQQSLDMCATRLESAKQIQQNLERLQTQQEAVLQTLASGLSAIARLQIAPNVQVAATAEELAQTVVKMHEQNYAIERAVEEVMTLKLD